MIKHRPPEIKNAIKKTVIKTGEIQKHLAANDDHNDVSHISSMQRGKKTEILHLPSSRLNSERKSPAFIAWPYFMFEKMLTPLLNPVQHVTSAVSWVDRWHVGSRFTAPKAHSRETDIAYHYLIELPGVEKGQITLQYHNGAISLRAQSRKLEKKELYSIDESHTVYRTFTLPVYTNGEAITARLSDGMLNIAIPKTDKPIAPKSRTINII